MATFSENTMVISGPIQHKRGTTEALEASNYVPSAGELVIATDTGMIKAGDGTNTWRNLPSYDGTEVADNLTTTTKGKALDASQGKALNDRVGVIEAITSIDCGEITAGE